GFILLPEPLRDLANGGAAEHARSGGVAEGRLDVPDAQPSGEHLHGQALELPRPAGQAGAPAPDERPSAIGHPPAPPLGWPLSRAPAAAPVAIAIAGARRRAMRVVLPAQGVLPPRPPRLPPRSAARRA